MLTFIFNKITTAIHILREGDSDEYGHVCGGPPKHQGTAIPGTSYHARVHYNLNLEDPRFGVVAAPMRWLPLYWAPTIFSDGFSYRIVSDSQIEYLSVPHTTESDSLYTEQLPEGAVTLVDFDYDPTKPEDAYNFAGIFGLEKLKKRQRAKRLPKNVVLKKQV